MPTFKPEPAACKVIKFPGRSSAVAPGLYECNRPIELLERFFREYQCRDDFLSCDSSIWSNPAKAFLAFAILRCRADGQNPKDLANYLCSLPTLEIMATPEFGGEPLDVDTKVRKLLEIGMAPRDRCAWLAEWRRRHNLTQAAAARLLGYADRRQIGQIERGRRLPSWQKILRAAEFDKGSSNTAI